MSQESIGQITSSETKTEIKEETLKIIKESEEILKKIQERFGEKSDEYLKIQKEYNDVQKSIINSLKKDRAITQSELAIIELEFTNMLKLKVGNNAVISLLNQTGKIARFLGADSSNVKFLGDKIKVTNQYQEDLVKKALGEDYKKGFNDKYILGYNDSIGNYLLSVDDFEKYIKLPNTKINGEKNDANTINSTALAHYFMYLESLGKLNAGYIKTIFSSKQWSELLKQWEKNPDSIAKKILSENNILEGNQSLGNFFKYYDTLDEKDVINQIKKDPEKVYLITNKNTLLECIKNIPEISYKNLNSYMQEDIDVIVSLSNQNKKIDIKDIPQSFFEIDEENPNDLNKIKQLFQVSKTEIEYLKIISELSTCLGEKKMNLLIKKLSADKSMNQYKNFFISLGDYGKKMSELTKKDFDSAIERLQKEKNGNDIMIINLYVYKHGIQGIENTLIKLLDTNTLEDFPGIHKHLYDNPSFAEKVILKHPEEFKKLSTTLQSKDNLVNAFIDSSMKETFEYSYWIEILSQIDLGKNIGIILLIYDKLVNKYSEEKVNNLFLHPKMSQKMQIFFKNLEGENTSVGQKNALKKLSGVFEKLVLEFENANNSISQSHKNYETSTNKNKDQLFLEKIASITGFERKINEQILDIIKQNPNDTNGRKLVGILKKATGGNNKKVGEILSSLQTLQIENIKSLNKGHEEILKKSGININDIENIINKNKKLKSETDEDYKKRILNIFTKEKKNTLTEGEKDIIEKYIQNNISLKNLDLQHRNTDLYIKYLENPEKFKTFEEYNQEKNTQINSQDKENQNMSNTITYGNGTSLDFEKKGSYYEIDTVSGKIEITKSEFQIIAQSEKALENMIHFKETLDELNIGGLWKYRESIFTGIRNNNLFSIDTQDDFINESEMIVFLRSILVSIGINAEVRNNLQDIKGKIILINKGSILNPQKEVNIYEDSFIESKFIQKFDPDRKQNSGMVTQLFGETLQEKNIIS